MYSIDVYSYIASNEPKRTENLIKSFGYTIRKSDMAQNLRELVDLEGENAVTAMMKIHPDMDYFCFNEDNKNTNSLVKNNDYSQLAYLNATGNNSQIMQTNNMANLTNVSIIVASLLLATAIIVKN